MTKQGSIIGGFPGVSCSTALVGLAAVLERLAPIYAATGRGLNNIGLGFRLRYEVRRQFAPYVGISLDRSFFGTANLIREAWRQSEPDSICGRCAPVALTCGRGLAHVFRAYTAFCMSQTTSGD